MKRPIKEIKPWLTFLTKSLQKYLTLRGTAKQIGTTYEVVRYYVIKYKLPYKYGNLTGYKMPPEDLKELRKNIIKIMRRKHGIYERFNHKR